MTKEKWHEGNKAQLYGVLILLFWVGIVLLIQSLPGGALFIRDTWWVFGAVGFLMMLGYVLRSDNTKASDFAGVIAAVLLGPVGVPTLLTYLILIRVINRRRRIR